jgi:hypothetical protein
MAEAPSPPPKVAPPPAQPLHNLPPPRLRVEPETKKILPIPVLLTVLIGCGVAAAYYYLQQPIVPQALPTAVPVEETKKAEPPQPIETPVEPPPEAPEPVPHQQAATPVEEPEPPPPTLPRQAEPQRPPRVAPSVEIPVRSQPSGATVMLDGLPGTACITPCALQTAAGEHTISLRLAGYKTLLRPIKVSDGPLDLPVITLAQAVGVLMLQSQPDGASITIDDRPWPGTTPTQVRLPPGRYRIAVQKGDLKSVQTVEIRDGDFRHLSIALNPQQP